MSKAERKISGRFRLGIVFSLNEQCRVSLAIIKIDRKGRFTESCRPLATIFDLYLFGEFNFYSGKVKKFKKMIPVATMS